MHPMGIYLYIYIICSMKQHKKKKEAPWLFWWSRSLGDESLLSGNQLGWLSSPFRKEDSHHRDTVLWPHPRSPGFEIEKCFFCSRFQERPENNLKVSQTSGVVSPVVSFCQALDQGLLRLELQCCRPNVEIPQAQCRKSNLHGGCLRFWWTSVEE